MMEQNKQFKTNHNTIDNLILNLSLSTKESDCFNRVDNSLKLKEGSGIGALVLFKKISKKKPSSEPKTVIIKENNYLIDGRTKNKKEHKQSQTNEPKKQYSHINNPETVTSIKQKNKVFKNNSKDSKSGQDSLLNIPKDHNDNETNEIDNTPMSKKARINNYIRNNNFKNNATESISSNNKGNSKNSQSFNDTHMNGNGSESTEKKKMTKTVIQTRNPNMNITKNQSDQSKENPLEKRKQYAVPPVKIKKEKSLTNTDNSLINNPNYANNNSCSFINPEEAEQKRQERLNDLRLNNEKICIMNYQKHEMNQMKQKEYIEMAKKMKFLQMNDVNVDELITEHLADGVINDEEEENQHVETEEIDEDQKEEEEYQKEFDNNAQDNNDEDNDEQLGTSTINQLDTKENVININNNSVTTNKHQTANKNNNSHFTYSQTSNVYGKRSQSDSTNSKETRKQKIDTFEYMMKIHEERGIRTGIPVYPYNNKSIDDSNNIQIADNQIDANKLINSFRQSSLSQNKEPNKSNSKSNTGMLIKADNKTNFVFDEDNNFVCSYKKNINTTTTNINKAQIREYMVEQRTKSKEKAIKVIEEEKMKQFKKYVELSKMQEIINRNRRAVAQKKKVRNEYYVGSQARRRSSNQITDSASTIIDPNDMLNNIMESHKIITSGLLNEPMYKKTQSEEEDDGENYPESNQSNNRSSHQQREEDSMMDQSVHSSTGFNKEITKEVIKNISKDAMKKGEYNNDDPMNISATSFGKLKESLLEKVNHTVKRANELLYSDALNQVLKSSFPKLSYNNSIDTVSDNDAIEDQLNIPIAIDGNQNNDFYHLMNNHRNNHIIEEQTETQKNSIQVPSTIQQSNIASITYDKENDKKRESIKDDDNNEENSKEVVSNEPKYCFSNEELEEYNDKFERFGEWFSLLNKRNCLNDIIIFGNTKLRYKLGFECMIVIFKSNPFSVLDYYSKYSIYSITLRKLFSPYIRRTLYHIVNYTKDDNQRLEEEHQTKKKVMEWMTNHDEPAPEIDHDKIEQVDYVIHKKEIDDNVEESSESEEEQEDEEENKEKKVEYDENYIKNLQYGLMVLRLPFIMYSLQKIAEYAYYEEKEVITEDAHQEHSQHNHNHNNNTREDKFDPNQDEEGHIKHDLSGEHHNTYLYNSFESKSSIILYPNSEKSDRLHRIYELVGLQKEDQNNSFNGFNDIKRTEEMHISFDNDNSKILNKNESNGNISEASSAKKSKSSKSLGEIVKMKPGISLKNAMNSLKSKSNRSNNQSLDNDNSFNKSLENNLKENSQSIKDVIDNAQRVNEPEINLPLSPSTLPKRSQVEKDNKEPSPMLDESDVNLPYTKKDEKYFSPSPIKPNDSGHVHKLEKCLTISEQDISADKDINNLVDWEYNLTGNKSSCGIDDIKKPALKEKDKIKFSFEPKKEAIISEENSQSVSKENEPIQYDQFIQKDINKDKELEDPIKKTESNPTDKNEENNYDNEFVQQMNISDVLDDNNLDSFMNSERKDQEDDEIDEEILLDQKDNNKEIILVPTPINEKSQSIENVFAKGVIRDNTNEEGINPIITKQKSIESDTNKKDNNNDKNEIEESESSCLIIKDKQEAQSCIFLDNVSSQSSNTFSYVNLNTPNENKSNPSSNTDNKSKPFVPIPNNDLKEKPLIHKRYDETDLRQHEIIEQAEPISTEALAEQITSEVIQNLLIDEIITEKHKLLPKKLMKSINSKDHLDNSSLHMSRSSDKGSNSPRRPMLQVNMNNNYNKDNNICNTSNDGNQYLNTSIFMRTIDDIKKEITLNLYIDKIAPCLIEEIIKEIDTNYKSIQTQLQAPLVCNVEQLIKGLIEKDDNLISTSKNKLLIPSRPFIRKRELLTSFNKVNKQLRNDDNITSDNYYDNILNECLIDASNEIIGAERLYRNVGLPLPWSNRTRHIKSNYDNNINSKEKLKTLVKEELERDINTKMGLIPENHECMDVEQLSLDREKKFMQCIGRELSDNQDVWMNYETEETQIKLAMSKIIMDQLLNETVEILEHVHYSRHEPNKYQSKSIYACEDIPRLSFQFTTENDIIDTINQ